jgi:hypothetical protein
MSIKQKIQTVELTDGRRIEVRRLKWKAARAFLGQLGGVLTGLYKGIGKDGKPALDAALATMADGLPELISGSDELIVSLVTGATALKAEEFGELDALEASEILAAAIAVNLDADLKNCWAAIGATIAGLIPAQSLPTGKAAPTPTS